MRRFAAVILLAPVLIAGCGDSDSPADSGSPAPLSVLFVTVDCLRADHVEGYGAPAGSTPALARLAQESVLFERAYANAPFTAPSHASLFTGLHTQSHGVLSWGTQLDPAARTWAQLFDADGYRTGAFFNHPSLAATGALRGFETQELEVLGPWQDTLQNFEAFLEAGADGPEPFAAWVHLWDVHRPYGYRNWSFFQEQSGRSGADLELAYTEDRLPAGTDLRVGRREDHYNLNAAERASELPLGGERPGRPVVRRVFDGEDWSLIERRYADAVRYADEGIGALVELLRERGELDSTLIVVTADHGEALTERPGCYFTHDPFLHEETLHVPLLVRWPDGRGAGTREAGLARGVDVMPTLLAAADLPVPVAVQGHDLFGERSPDAPAALAFAETRTRSAKLSGAQLGRNEEGWLEERVALFDGRYRLLVDLATGAQRLYDLERDPGETQDVSADPAVAEPLARLAAQLDLLVNGLPRASGSGTTMNCDEARELVELGYLDPSVLEDCDE